MDIVGVPEGYELVAIGKPREGDEYIGHAGGVYIAGHDFGNMYPLVRKLPELREGAWYERRDGKIVGPAKTRDGMYTHSFSCEGYLYMSNGRTYRDCQSPLDLVKEAPSPKKEVKYRPFANAAEFVPHADRWLKYIGTKADHRCRVDAFNDEEWWVSGEKNEATYQEMLDKFVFADDGSPCGVKVEE